MDPIHQIPNINKISTYETKSKESLTSICLTEFDRLLVAIGYKNGAIDLFDIQGNVEQKLTTFYSHKNKVNVLRFSSWHFSHEPNKQHKEQIILVSLSEEICFWNITYALNNPIERTQLRLSQRFNKRLSTNTPSTNSMNGNSNEIFIANGNAENTQHNNHNNNNYHNSGNDMNGNSTIPTKNMENEIGSNSVNSINKLKFSNPWIGKCGAAKKPELLSCIKFVGSSAEKIFINKTFTKFITVDNEGEIYYLKTLDFRQMNMDS